MSFLRKLFGGGESKPTADKEGFFVYVQCDHCGKQLRLRVQKQHDLNREDGGYVWHKTIVDSRCFRQMPAVVHFDGAYDIVSAEIDGGRFISQAEFEAESEAQQPADVSQPTELD